MKIKTFEEWKEQENKRLEYYKSLKDTKFDFAFVEQRMKQRDEIHVKFPYTAIVAGDYWEQDYAEKWLWMNISPKDGECKNNEGDFPGCPLVLATEFIKTGTYIDQGKTKTWREKAYKEVEEHSHEGTWQTFWLGKTGYDYGDNEFCFQNEVDRDRFLAAVPTFDYTGEQLGDLEDDNISE
jgi:hypothetical protein